VTAPATAPFVSQLRAGAQTIRMAGDSADAVTIRVEMPEVWNVVRVVVAPGEPVLKLKVRALEALFPQAEMHEDFVLKLRGWEILNESVSLTEAGVVNGSILLLTHRRRRPVR
jgi:hypothetical protein